MKIKHVLVSVIASATLMASAVLPAFADASPTYIEGKNLSWNVVEGKSYWYENGVKQGTLTDPKAVVYDKTVRGREIYDKASDGWYWLDAIYEGAKAVNKEVFMPYIYQNESSWSDADMKANSQKSDTGLADYVYKCIKEKTGKWVRYDENGKMFKGWVTIQGKLAETYPKQKGNTYYYDTMTGLMAKGWVTLEDGVSYHFDEITGKLLETSSSAKNGEELVTIYYDKAGTPGKVYAIEADINLQGTGDGYSANLVIGNGNDSIKYGLTYQTQSTNANASGKTALTSEMFKNGNSEGKAYHDVYYTTPTVKATLMMIVDSKSGTAFLFHDHKFIGYIINGALEGDDLYIRVEGAQAGNGIAVTSFKNVKVKNPVNGEEIITTKGTPEMVSASVKNIDYAPYIADSKNGYAHCGVTVSNGTSTSPKEAYGYLEFVNGATIK